MDIYTIGFTQTTAQHFFDRLKTAGVERLLDVRLHNSSQLAGFAKAQDLPFFLGALLGASYEHDPRLAPTAELLAEYRKRAIDWPTYEGHFLDLLFERHVERALSPAQFEVATALLCSEASAEHCHRRLICEHLARHWPDVHAVHL